MRWFDPVGLFVVYSILLVALVVLSRRVANAKLRHGLMQVVLVLVVFGIILFVEMFSLFKLYKRWDLTENQRYTFSSMTVNLLKSLEGRLRATAFVETSAARMQYENLLSNAYYYNPSMVEYEFADPEVDFEKALRFPQPLDPPVLFLEYEGKVEKVASFSEEDFAQTLAKLTRGETKTVYLLQGHGERALERAEEGAGRSYSYLQTLLEGQNKRIEPFEIDPEDMTIPEDCDVLLVAGPEIDLTSGEYSAIDRYLIGAGKAIFLLDNDQAPGLAQWLRRYGFHLQDDLLVELEQSLQITSQGLQPVTTLNLAVQVQLREHAITRELMDKRIYAIEARSVTLEDPLPEGLTAAILADSSSNSWAELHPEYDNLEEAEFDEGVELQGPVPMGAVVSGTFALALGIPSATEAAEGTLIVFGDSDFASDRTYGRSYGLNLLVNMINYLTEETELISIPPKTQADMPYVRMTGARWGQLLLVSFVLLPGAVLLAGLGTYLRRRKSG